MNPLRILAAATAMEICAAAAILGLAGLAGSRNGWLDVINSFAPLLLAMAILGVGLAFASLDPGGVRNTTIALALIGAACNVAQLVPEFVGQDRPGPAVGGPGFRVLSANVWTNNPTPDLAVAQILAANPDALLLQEVDGNIANSLAALKPLYPYSSDCAGSGLKIFVKSPILAQSCGNPPGPKSIFNLVWVQTTAADGRRITLATTHFAHPLPPLQQEWQRRALAAELHTLPSDDLILAGDFNTAPWTFAMRRQDRSLAPLRRRTIAWVSWPARVNLFNVLWSAPFLPIDHIYAGPKWRTERLVRLRLAGSDHFATGLALSGTP